MTSIICNIVKSGTSEPLDGFIRVLTEVGFGYDDTLTVSVPVDFPLVSGAVTIDLEPSDIAKVAYRFEIWQYTPDELDSEGEPFSVPDVLIKAFSAAVPFSATPINFKDLATQTGVRYNAQDSSLLTLSRFLYNSDLFWEALATQVWTNKGEWQPDVYYKRGDMVRYQGSTYQFISSIATEGIVPTNTAYWVRTSTKGDPGSGTGGDDTPYGLSWVGSENAASQDALYSIISTLATQASLEAKANLNSPVLTGDPRVPTQVTGDRSTSIANTNWVGSNLISLQTTLNNLIGLKTDTNLFNSTVNSLTNLINQVSSESQAGLVTKVDIATYLDGLDTKAPSHPGYLVDSSGAGYLKLGTLLIKWGSSTVTLTAGAGSLLYSGVPSFTSVATVILTNGDSSTGGSSPVSLTTFNSTGFTFLSSGTIGSYKVNWLAIGATTA
jgi:hypothetical protein